MYGVCQSRGCYEAALFKWKPEDAGPDLYLCGSCVDYIRSRYGGRMKRLTGPGAGP